MRRPRGCAIWTVQVQIARNRSREDSLYGDLPTPSATSGPRCWPGALRASQRLSQMGLRTGRGLKGRSPKGLRRRLGPRDEDAKRTLTNLYNDRPQWLVDAPRGTRCRRRGRQRPRTRAQLTFPVVTSRHEPRHDVDHRHGGQTVGAALAGFIYALVGGVNNTVSTGLASVNKRIDDVRRPAAAPRRSRPCPGASRRRRVLD